MKRSQKRLVKTNYRALARALAAVAAIVIIVGGVTFAALQSQQVKITGNTIQTATANLGISTEGFNYASSQPGFIFDDLVPGGAAVPTSGYTVYIKNSGSAALALKLSVSSQPTNPGNVDLSKVNVILTPNGGGNVQSIPLQTLIDADATGGFALTSPTSLAGSGGITQYTLRISMAADALSGSSATLGNIDFAFSGVSVTN